MQVNRTTAGVPGDPEEDGRFGASTEAADLDGDGYTDLVVTTAAPPTRCSGAPPTA